MKSSRSGFRSRRRAFLWLALAALAAPMGTACTGGGNGTENSESRDIEGHAKAATANNAGVLGMELPSAWSIATSGATITQSTTHTQGSYALSVRPSNSNGYTPLKSAALSTLDVVSPTLAVDLRLPSYQPNPYWLGAAQAYIDCPSRGIYSQYLSQVELTGKPLNTWFTASFTVASDSVSKLLQAGYSDLTITIVLNVQVPTTGSYLVDNVRFLPQPSNGCNGMPNGTLCSAGLCQNGTCVAPATPTNVRATPSTVNAGASSTLSAASPTAGATLLWYAGSACAGTSIASGTSVSSGALASTSSFSVRAQYGQAVSACVPVTVTVAVPTLTITQQPVSKTVVATPGGTTTFTLAATGAATVIYSWYTIDGSGTRLLGSGPDPGLGVGIGVTGSFPQVYTFYCVVSDGAGHSVQSNTVTLTITAPALLITQQPVSTTVKAHTGGSVEFTLAATGTGPLTYAWYAVEGSGPRLLGSGPDPGLGVSTAPNGGTYPQVYAFYAVVTDGVGQKLQSDTVTLTLTAPGPTITQQPVSKMVPVANGGSVEFTLAATGEGTLTYAWYAVEATGPRLLGSGPDPGLGVSTSPNGGALPQTYPFFCVVTDANGSAQSETVTLTLLAPEFSIIQQPVSKIAVVQAGGSVEFTLAASGIGPITYKWYAVEGSGPRLLGSGPDPGLGVSTSPNSGTYPQVYTFYCVVVDGAGQSLQSNTVTLTLLGPGPLITQQPVSQTAVVQDGGSVEFTLAATGTGPLTYAWYGVESSGPRLLGSGPDPGLGVSTSPNSGSYPQTYTFYCVVTDALGQTRQSDTVTLTLLGPGPLITQQPVSQTAVAHAGGSVEFTLAATGAGPLTYAWYGVEGSGPRLLGSGPDPGLGVSTSPNSGTYPQVYTFYCVVTDASGQTRQSNTVTLTITAPALAITQAPFSQTVAAHEGGSVEFTLAASGLGPLTYAWYAVEGSGPRLLGSGPDPGLGVSTSPNSGSYPQVYSFYCVVTDAVGQTVQSQTVTLTLLSPGPMITKAPVSQTVEVQQGGSVEFTIAALGTGPLTYAWYAVDGSGPRLLGSGPDPGLGVSTSPNSGTYPQVYSFYCVVTDAAGQSRQSATVTLTLTAPALVITQPPVSQTVAAQAGGSVEFTLAATGFGPLTYAWYGVEGSGPRLLGSGPDPGLGVSTAPNGGSYPQVYNFYCVVTDGLGQTVQSSTVTLTLLSPGPMITTQPVSQTATAHDGGSVEFTLAATGAGPLTYAWYAVEGSGPRLLGSGPDPGLGVSTSRNSGSYPQVYTFYCVVTDALGQTRQSDTVTLTLLAPS